jgi:hypothetical protein
MSSIAAAGHGEITGGLKPRYLRSKDFDAASTRLPAEVVPEAQARPAFAPVAVREPAEPSVTQELRRRIAASTRPTPRRVRPLLFGLAAVAAIAVAAILFPDTVFAFLPDADPTL